MAKKKQPKASANYVIEIKKNTALNNPYSSNLSPIQTNPNNHSKNKYKNFRGHQGIHTHQQIEINTLARLKLIAITSTSTKVIIVQ